MNNKQKSIKSVQLKLASREDILKWSFGEVKNSNTLNYKNGNPEDDGLFDQKIFGPVKDYQCSCGKYKGVRYKGRICEKCGVEITNSNVRRERMGHIILPFPVVHTWFINDLPNPSKISLLLDIDKRINEIIYYQSYIVLDNAGLSAYYKNKEIINLDEKHGDSKRNRVVIKKIVTEVILPKLDKKSSDYKYTTELLEMLQDGNYAFNIDEILFFISKKTNIKFSIGPEAVLELLKKLDVDKEIKSVKKKLNQTSPDFPKQIARFKVLNYFKKSNNKIENMFTDVIPVTPPDTRPLVALSTGNYTTSDINELYRKIIMRIKSMNSLVEMNAPMRIIYEQKRNIQVAVDELFDSTVGAQKVNHLKSITEYLKGKTGLFRQNLLGKRVDFSARSAIVGAPELKLYEAGIPMDIILKLFKPFIISELLKEFDENGEQLTPIVSTFKEADELINEQDEKIWPIVNKVIKERPVILNRAPTLHKLGVQAFEIKPTSGKAIRLHPLVCTGFNADFDGDTMALHLPISQEAVNEARWLMLSMNNIIMPKDGSPAITPTKDMPLGIYYLTIVKKNELGEGMIFSTFGEMLNALQNKCITIHSIVGISSNAFLNKTSVKKNEIIVATAGRFIFNNVLPKDFALVKTIMNIPMGEDARKTISQINVSKLESGITKSEIGKIINQIYAKYDNIITSKISDEIKNLGFKYGTKSGTTFSIFDFPKYTEKNSYIGEGIKKVLVLRDQCEEGLLTDDERYTRVVDVWNGVKTKVTSDMEKIINDENNKFNSVILMNKSGAVGALPQFTQMVGMRGLMLKSYNYNLAKNNKDSKIIKDTIESPVLSSFHEGLTISEYFNSAYGARKSMVDTALKTSKSGYMTRKLVDCAQDVIVREDDCGTKIGIIVSAITNDENQIIEKISERIIGRTSVNDIKVKNEVIVAANEIIDQAMAKKIENAGITSVEIFSPIKCNCKNGICKKCYGIDISTKKSIENNMPVGVIAAQSLGEPVTQLNMRAKATGGVAGGVQIAQGYERIKQLFDVVSPKEHELAQIAENNGIVTSIEIQDENNKVTIKYENDDIVTYAIPLFLKLLVGVDEKVIIGQKLSIGLISLKNMLNISGVDETRKYIINEVQKTYRSQGLEINDKYIEIIIKKMTDNMTVIDAGDSDDVYIGQNMKVSELLERNNKLLAKKQIPIAAKNEIYGLDLIPAKSASFLSAASFQYTKKILINAALSSQIDELMSLKENVMMGKLIPVGTGINTTKEEIIANGKKALESEY